MYQLDLFTETSTWSPISTSKLPDWRGLKIVGVDTETKDPALMELGPGFIRGDAHVLGISLAIDKLNSYYIPIGHYSGNMEDVNQALRWVKDVVESAETVLFANAHYDMDALNTLGIRPRGRVYDIQVVDAVIDETHNSYSLESIAQRRLDVGKEGSELKDFLKIHNLKWSDLDKLEAGRVAKYAERDASLLPEIWIDQQEDIRRYDLKRAVDRETKLTKVLWDMHQKGVPINESKANELNDKWSAEAEAILARARSEVGFKFNPTSPKHLGAIVRERGFLPSVTEKGNDSVSNDFLVSTGDKILYLIAEYRKLNKIRKDYVEGVFLKYAVNGRVHPQWFQSRNSKAMSDGADGASTGRITGSKPNLTQIPARSDAGLLCREIVEAEHGEDYCKLDYSSQEPRIGLEFASRAKCTGADIALARYQEDKNTDYHSMVKDLIYEQAGVEVSRFEAKTCNLGLSYGMQEKKLSFQLGISQEAASVLLRAYHTGVPYVSEITRKAIDVVEERGYIITLGGSIRHFNKWGSRNWGDKEIFDTREECMAHYGSAQRVGLHKAFNAAVQGSAADQMKEAIIAVHSEVKTPLLQVYDEIGLSIVSEKEARLTAEIMENALPMSVPSLVEPSIGKSWGNNNAI